MPQAKQTSVGSKNGAGPKKRTRISQSDVPAHTLDEAIDVPRAIYENYGGDPTKPFDVAAAMDLPPQSTRFKMICGAAIAYGLTDGARNAKEIAITPLGLAIVRPLEEGADLAAKRQAILKPRVVGEFLRKYDGSPLPKEQIACHVLNEMGVPRERAASVFGLVVRSADDLGLVREIKGTRYISLGSANQPAARSSQDSEQPEDEAQETQAAQAGTLDGAVPLGTHKSPAVVRNDAQRRPRRVFITHGKNQAFIAPIKKLLAFGELEAVVSVEKQSVSKPVPDKVLSEMRSCDAAIIHVEDEERLLDSEANERVVLNPNVLIEIGAAMGLYGRRFILLVKEGVKLPSNLQGLYEVRYSGDNLDGPATIKLLEAINALKADGDA
ncbi:MAG: nucleotide-binding protein [Euryarchaeota archaeon]|nr:nucleotide-binding protein [Euryarchaeota archaeon]